MLKNILVVLDGSEIAEMVLPYSVLLAARSGATLSLLFLGRSDYDPLAIDGQEYLEQLRATISVNSTLFESENYRPFKTRLLVAEGNFARQTLDAVLETGADLIMVSSHHPKNELKRLEEINLLKKIGKASPVPIMLVNPSLEKDYRLNLAKTFHQPEQYDLYAKPIILPLDGTLEAEVIFKSALSLADTLVAPLALLRVTQSRTELIEKMGPIVSSEEIFWESVDDTLAAQALEAEEYLNGVQSRDFLAEYRLTSRVEEGYPPVIIADYAEQQQAGLIAMASHFYTGPEGFFLGSVAGEVIEGSTTPVLLVKRHTGAIKEKEEK